MLEAVSRPKVCAPSLSLVALISSAHVHKLVVINLILKRCIGTAEQRCGRGLEIGVGRLPLRLDGTLVKLLQGSSRTPSTTSAQDVVSDV